MKLDHHFRILLSSFFFSLSRFRKKINEKPHNAN